MFKVILLVCAASVPRSDCQPNTALQVVLGSDANNAISCLMQSQSSLAGTTIGRTLSKAEYIKVKCVRTIIGKGNVG